MKRLAPDVRFSLFMCAFLCAAPVAGQEGAESAQKPSEEGADAERARLEKAFAETLTGATLTGRWRVIRDGALGEEHEEKYSISSATKSAGDLWIIVARVQYGEKDVTLPVPVRVRWAGDTPVICVTDAGLPGLGTYTARVLVYRDIYTGSWFGPDVAGTLSGTIRREGDEKTRAEDQTETRPAPDSKKESPRDDRGEGDGRSEDDDGDKEQADDDGGGEAEDENPGTSSGDAGTQRPEQA